MAGGGEKLWTEWDLKTGECAPLTACAPKAIAVQRFIAYIARNPHSL
ncbi:hypothetical protein MPLA_110024 [Mesorhizobium sp. ORS 3359]|nr:hypothetical protein MPLA_110024 [Mesorhizobium sp. ORS 3359]